MKRKLKFLPLETLENKFIRVVNQRKLLKAKIPKFWLLVDP